jgi:transposase InsO family protein
VVLSVGRKGQCWDNAVAESFFATIKTELLDRRAWRTRTATHKAIFEWIEGWYNTRRRHSTLDNRSPSSRRSFTRQRPRNFGLAKAVARRFSRLTHARRSDDFGPPRCGK